MLICLNFLFDKFEFYQLAVKPVFIMKKTLLTFGIIFLSVFGFSQEIIISAGSNLGIPFYYQFVAGGPGKGSKPGFNSNIEYILINNRKVSSGFGLGFQNSRVVLTPQFIGGDEELISQTKKCNVLSVYYKMVFRKRLSSNMSFNPLIGIQLSNSSVNSVSNQTGLGFSYSYGKKINLSESVFLKVEPKLSVYNIVPFVSADLPERLTSIVLNIGLGIR